MATTEKRTTGLGYDGFAGFEAAQSAFRDLLGFQVRAAKSVIDTGMTFSRKATEQFTVQFEEGLKMQQEALKYGFNLVEDWKKVAFETAEKAVKTDAH